MDELEAQIVAEELMEDGAMTGSIVEGGQW